MTKSFGLNWKNLKKSDTWVGMALLSLFIWGLGITSPIFLIVLKIFFAIGILAETIWLTKRILTK